MVMVTAFAFICQMGRTLKGTHARHVMDQVHSRLLQQAAGQPVDPVPPPYPARPRKVVSIMEDALPTPELLADLLWELRGGMDYV